ncbi:HD domain-containing phosphohydrolase [Burkholderia sp. L27(2015)]|uniref:HD domain-containing phosphohydrolase n=1 Tax=Burkholderia sp. L27(2015) TaxID=1641858 RepID=UPI001C207084|nr:HD domain-containing phosphohydrolase [Burkholderia sp. L27(2015)]
MRTKLKVRFHFLFTAFVALFVITLTAVTIIASQARFKSLAEENTRTLFSLIAQRNADQLQTMIAGATAAVQDLSSLELTRILPQGHLNRAELVPTLITTLRANPHAYSLYFGFRNGEFLQVIGVRDRATILAALHAPAGTWFAARFIEPDRPGAAAHREHWQYLSENEEPLGQVTRDAQYVPRLRPWFTGALSKPGLFVTEPYRFESLQDMGLTLSEALADQQGAVGIDLALDGLDGYAAASLEGRDGGIVVTDGHERVPAAHAASQFAGQPVTRLQSVARSANPFFASASQLLHEDGSRIVLVGSEAFAYASRSVAITPSEALHVVAFAPMSLYTGPVEQTRNNMILLAALMLLVSLPLIYWGSRRLSGALGTLTRESERIEQLDFSGETAVHSMVSEIETLGHAQQTMKAAIRERTEALDAARATLENLLESGVQLSSRRDRDTVMHQTLTSARRIANAQAGQFWICTDDDETLRLVAYSSGNDDGAPLPKLEIALASARHDDPCAWAAARREPLLLDAHSTGFDLASQQSLLGHMPATLLAVPVTTHGEKLMGVLVLTGAGISGAHADAGAADAAAEPCAFDHASIRYVETLAAQSGIALENIALLDAQKVLMESLLQLIASAIDAKSAYTGGHCARVPELARMLAEAACEVNDGPLSEFRFKTEEEWHEFRIGTWLHDCGKVTTPEFVVDKATKLETIYNRIHEIRMRFEVLLRDAEIEHLKSILAGGDVATQLFALEARRTQLADDFTFVAKCNIGGEFMARDDQERLRTIAQQTWLRHFDDRLGLSHGEEDRYAAQPASPLPVQEGLLADKPEHIVPRTERQHYDARYGFRMDVPEHLYNFGEVHNLCIERGTLTAEERYKINEHIVQTVVMLDQLPLPSNLSRVPEYACTHHETLAGTGYPRRLDAKALSVPARIMAIADIFEALTAADRPYKKAKSLTEAVRILSFFKKDGHIDADLFDLFLTSGVYLRYAEMYMAPEQIDEVDVAHYVEAMPV